MCQVTAVLQTEGNDEVIGTTRDYANAPKTEQRNKTTYGKNIQNNIMIDQQMH
jgi:hypothetical protein